MFQPVLYSSASLVAETEGGYEDNTKWNSDENFHQFMNKEKVQLRRHNLRCDLSHNLAKWPVWSCSALLFKMH